MLRFWMQHSVAAARGLRPASRALGGRGRLAVAADRPRTLVVNTAGLGRRPAGPRRASATRSPLTVGADADPGCPTATRPTCPATSAHEDACVADASTREPLDEPFELLGSRWRICASSCDRPAAFVAVRLCEVLPDGGSLLVTPRHPQPLPPRVARAPGGARARQAVQRRAAAEGDRARGSPPATGCGLRSRPATGHGSGRRPSWRR